MRIVDTSQQQELSAFRAHRGVNHYDARPLLIYSGPGTLPELFHNIFAVPNPYVLGPHIPFLSFCPDGNRVYEECDS